MTIKLNFIKNHKINSSSNLILFCNEKPNLDNLKKFLSKTEFDYLKDLIKVCDLKKNIFNFSINSKKSIILV